MANHSDLDKAVKAMGGMEHIVKMNAARMALYQEAQKAGIHPEVYLTEVLLGERANIKSAYEKIMRGESL